jgi:TatD DNase family protein
MFDSHCHLDDEAYDGDREAVVARAKAAGVTGIVVPGFEPDEWPRLPGTCALDPMIGCGVGLHPWYVHTLSDAQREAALARLPELARAYRVVAIGECGLDAAKAKRDGAPLSLQRHVLEAHLELAWRLELPIILHCVGAHGALLDLLEARGPLPAGGVMHSYSGSAELVPRYARLGLFFGFAGIVTRPNASRPKRALAAVPLDRLLFESDGPDQAPAQASTRRSEPAHIPHVLAAACAVRSETADELRLVTALNARKLFRM